MAFIRMVTLEDFIHRLVLNQHNKQHNIKVLLNSFHLNGHTLGFHPQTHKLAPCRLGTLEARLANVLM